MFKATLRFASVVLALTPPVLCEAAEAAPSDAVLKAKVTEYVRYIFSTGGPPAFAYGIPDYCKRDFKVASVDVLKRGKGVAQVKIGNACTDTSNTPRTWDSPKEVSFSKDAYGEWKISMGGMY
jgi:hypothetical protein